MKHQNLQDYIVVLDDVLPHSVCDKIIDEYSQSNDWQQTVVGSGNVVTEVRSATTVQMSADFVLAKNPELRKELDSDVFTAAAFAIKEYKSRFDHCLIEKDSGYELLCYEVGQFYKQHVDSFRAHPRAVSCSFSLNDVLSKIPSPDNSSKCFKSR